MKALHRISSSARWLILVGLFVSTIQAQSKSGVNGDWEYTIVYRAHSWSGSWSDWVSKEDDSSEPLPGTLAQQLSRLGAQGWELVSSDISYTTSDNGFINFQQRTLIFKRPKR